MKNYGTGRYGTVRDGMLKFDFNLERPQARPGQTPEPLRSKIIIETQPITLPTNTSE